MPTPSPCEFETASKALLTTFDAYPLRAPRIAWLNQRYFISRGYDLLCRDVVAQIERDCISNYAVSTLPNLGDTASAPVQMGADRYGGSDGTAYGGSGRCGVRSGHIAKGIGPTPLVTPGAPWSYSHGQLFMHDAIREAIAAELTDAELPNGAVRTIAIIDTGHSLAEHPDGPYYPCAIAVRPCFFRAAHLERSIFFGTSGFAGSDQCIDAQRVRDLNNFLREYRLPGLDDSFSTVQYLVQTTRQIAAIRAHRLWNGRPATGNMTISGQYFDFGAFRALPNWGKGDDQHGQVFGDDIEDLAKAQDSLDYFQGKYCGIAPSKPEQQSILLQLIDDLDKHFAALCVQSSGAGSHKDEAEIGAAFLEYFHHAQRCRYAIDCPTRPWERIDWLDTAMTAHLSGTQVAVAARPLVTLLANALTEDFDDPLQGRYRLLRMARWLQPRPTQYYGVSRGRAIDAVRRANEPGENFSVVIDRHIRGEIAKARRVWNALADDVVVLGITVLPEYDAIFVYRVGSDCFDTIYQVVSTIRGAPLRGEWIDLALVEQCREPDSSPRLGLTLLSDDQLIAAGHRWRTPVVVRPDHIFDDAMAIVTKYRGPPPWK